jgi:hypothetical protein
MLEGPNSFLWNIMRPKQFIFMILQIEPRPKSVICQILHK